MRKCMKTFLKGYEVSETPKLSLLVNNFCGIKLTAEDYL